MQEEEIRYIQTYLNSMRNQDIIQDEIENKIPGLFKMFNVWNPNLTGGDHLRKRLEVMQMIKLEVVKSKAQLVKNHSSIRAMFHAKIMHLRSVLTLINFLLYDLV